MSIKKVSKRSNKKSNSVFDKITYNMSGVDRINQIPDFEKTLSSNFLENIILKYFLMNKTQIEEESKNPALTVIERMVLQQIVTSLSTRSKNSFAYSKYLQERISGTVRERLEHSGPNGSPITISKEDSIDSFLDTLNDKELEAYEKAVKVISKVKARHGKDT